MCHWSFLLPSFSNSEISNQRSPFLFPFHLTGRYTPRMELLPIRELKILAPANPGDYRIHAQVEKAISKQAKSGSPYMELSLVDAENQITLRAWNDSAAFSAASELKNGAWVEVTGHWYENGGFGLDARDWKLRPLSQEEIDAVIGGSPELAAKQKADYEYIEQETSAIADPRLRALCAAFMEQFGERFMRAGAARFNHHARRGGLVEHVAQMMRTAVSICVAYPQLNRDLIVTGVLFHDCGKLWENCYTANGFTMPFTDHGELLGHINIGIEIANKLWREFQDTPQWGKWVSMEPSNEQVRLHLLHLIASHHGQYEYGAPVLPKTPEAVVLHHVDNIDAKLEMFFQGYQTSKPLAANILERVRPLQHNLVRALGHYVVGEETQPATDDDE